MCAGLDHLFDVPDEGPDADLFVAFVEFAHGEEQVFHLVVVDHGHDGVVHFGPSVGAAVRVAVEVAASLHILPEGESADGEYVEQVFHALGVGLIEYDEYAFHASCGIVGNCGMGVILLPS